MTRHGFYRAFFILLPAVAVLAQEPANPHNKVIVLVEPGTSLIEAKSLLPDSRFAAAQLAGERLGTSAMQDMAAEIPDASAYYRFNLLPKEELICDLKSEDTSKVWMQFMAPKFNDAMAAQFRRANLPPQASRARRIRITNVTDRPYEVALALFGWTGYSYRLTMKRQGGVPLPSEEPKVVPTEGTGVLIKP